MTVAKQKQQGLLIIRLVLCMLLLIHGVTRLRLGTVGGFGEFLSGNGIPFGTGIAWFITLFEIAASILMASGRFVMPIALVFSGIYACGIWLVHWAQGWFVVGPGTGGTEYSVLIIACLLGLAWAHRSEFLK